MPDYTPEFYIRKFKRIPSSLWITENFGSGKRHCALGHCGMRDRSDGTVKTTEESKALMNWFSITGQSVASVNDNHEPAFPQPTPKARILAALHYIKERQCQNS